jgi:hypothetical protein
MMFNSIMQNNKAKPKIFLGRKGTKHPLEKICDDVLLCAPRRPCLVVFLQNRYYSTFVYI